MAVQMKYEQVCVFRCVVDLLRAGQMNSLQLQELPWQLVGELNVAKMDAGDNHVFVHIAGGNGSAHKVELMETFFQANLVHWVYAHRSFPNLNVVIRPVPQDTMQLVLDLKLESSSAIYASMRDIDGVPVTSTYFDTHTPLTVARLKVVVKGLLKGHHRSFFAALEVYMQGANFNLPGLSSHSILWLPHWQVPRGRFTKPPRRLSAKSGPEHPDMAYFLACGL